MHPANQRVVEVFTEIANILEVQGENQFRIATYRNVADHIRKLGKSIHSLSENELKNIPGVGASTLSKILEIKQTGTCKRLRELKATGTPSLSDVRKLKGLGGATARQLWQAYGIKDMKGMRKALKNGKLDPKLKRRIEKALKEADRIPRDQMLKVLTPLVERMKKLPFVEKLEVAGSIRREMPTVRDVDIVVAVPPLGVGKLKIECQKIFGTVTGGTKKLITSIVVLGERRHVDIVVTSKGSFGAALNYLTGSAQHNIHLRKLAKKKGLKVNEHGIFKGGVKVGGEREEDLFELLGLKYLEPRDR